MKKVNLINWTEKQLVCNKKVIALVPAHNEEIGIERTIVSLLNQTYSLSRIVVICDNCTDKTVDIVRNLKKHHSRVDLELTIGNAARKAGALNWGYDYLTFQDIDFDYIVQMDADTILFPNTVEMGIREFESPPMSAEPNLNLGGVCSRFLVSPLTGSMTWFDKVLWNIQNIEYSMADAERVMSVHDCARILSGTCSIYPKVVLDQVAHMRPQVNGIAQIWSISSIVEDYTLTNDVRSLGYETRCAMNMVNLTNVPESFKEYWAQRVRWYTGTITELRNRGFTDYTTPEIMVHFFGLLMMVTRIVFYGLIVFLLFNHLKLDGLQSNPLTYTIPCCVFYYNWYRAKYIRINRSLVQLVMIYSFIPLELYSILREILMLRSYYLSFFRKRATW